MTYEVRGATASELPTSLITNKHSVLALETSAQAPVEKLPQRTSKATLNTAPP